MNMKRMNIKTLMQRSLGLLLLLLLFALKDLNDNNSLLYAVAFTFLAFLACGVAGYFLRTFWALLIVPVVHWGGSYLFGYIITPDSPIITDPFSLIAGAPDVFFYSQVPIVLLTLLGVLLGKRSEHKQLARKEAALAAS
jgi:hypothetical protein